MKTRLDAELVRRGLARSRDHASDLIESRSVLVSGIPATKPATQVDPETSITLTGNRSEFVSRGGQKLAGALAELSSFNIAGRDAIDAGASTGGFTDVLLKSGVRSVIAVDVGYGQLAWELRQDPRVTVLDRTNIRHLTSKDIGKKVDVIVADLSFISLNLVLPAFLELTKPDAEILVMVKPQFEVGRENLGAGGVVREPNLRRSAVKEVADTAYSMGLGCKAVVASQLPGPSGNVEYFLWLTRGVGPISDQALDQAIAQGPQ